MIWEAKVKLYNCISLKREKKKKQSIELVYATLPRRALRVRYVWTLLTFLVMISGFLISNRWSPLLFISEVKAGSIPMEPVNPSSYSCGHPGLLLTTYCHLVCLQPKANCAPAPHDLWPDGQLTFPLSQPLTKSSPFPEWSQQKFTSVMWFPPTSCQRYWGGFFSALV